MTTQPTFLEQQIHELPADEYRIAAINKYAFKELPPMGTVMDFGAGAGHLVNLAIHEQPDIKVHAVDISPILLEYMRDRFQNHENITVTDGTQQQLPQNHFDRIYTLDVLEHVEDDLQYMKDLKATLKSGGKMFINVPAHQHLFSQFDTDLGHFRRYSREDLESKLNEAGFIINRISYWNTLGYLIVHLSQTYDWFPRPASVRQRTTTKEEMINTLLRWWFLAVENHTVSPKGLSLTAIVTKR